MKNILCSCLVLVLLGQSLFAQNDIHLNIHHKLGNQAFNTDATASNNLDDEFKVSRLEYYLSKISFIDADGMEINTKDHIELIDVVEQATSSLVFENMDINAVAKVRFSIGVDPDRNHLDPATFPNDHPLAPQFPSMHWGWTAGYRFLAMEGKVGSSFDEIFEFHGLGDANYFQTEIPITAVPENGIITIDLDADYTRILENIELSGGIVVHSEDGLATTVLQNFRDYVFNVSSGTTSTVDLTNTALLTHFQSFPNPAIDGQTTVTITAQENFNYQLKIHDSYGREIQSFPSLRGDNTLALKLSHRGFYWLSIYSDQQVIATQKLWSN